MRLGGCGLGETTMIGSEISAQESPHGPLGIVTRAAAEANDTFFVSTVNKPRNWEEQTSQSMVRGDTQAQAVSIVPVSFR